MAFHLTVAGSLEPLADALAGVLADPLPGADPFESELVVIPGEGVKAWLRARLSRQLGATGSTPNGIVANIDHLFPASVVHAALGDDLDLGLWTTGPLTWSIHEVLLTRAEEFGQHPDALRARAIADLFDRYTLHRHRMVVQWSEGRDVDATGAALEAHQLWQPALWRAVQAHLSPDPANPLPTDAQRMVERTDQLRAGTHQVGEHPHLRRRVMFFGLASLPSAHLEVIAALSTQLDVHIYAPTASARRWEHVRDQLEGRLALPVGRGDPRMPIGVGHPLVTTWGRPSRESHALLLDAASHVPAVIVAPDPVPVLPEAPSLLARLQHDIRSDQQPLAPEARPVLDAADMSVRWHRAHGPARQVEILRDHLLHLFTETDDTGAARFMPRDVAVLCSDITTFAPLIEATFAGDPRGGVPSIPVRVADRTVRQQSALLDTAGALLDLLDGRFRASQVLDFAVRAPVRLRFGLGTAAIARLEDWAAATNVRWGLDSDDHTRFGLPADLAAHTWQSGIDQLLVGSTMTTAGPRLASFGVAPFPDLEGAEVEIAGAFAELLHQLRRVTASLRTDASVHDWCEALLDGLHALCDTSPEDSWQWRDVERAVSGFRDEARLGDSWRTTVVPASELTDLMRIRLDTSSGRPRFGTGSVTVSSLTAQRGVPQQVVCLLGIDDDLGAGAMAAAEDLIAITPCIGDRDARSEHRAQLLDAVLCAGQRLVLLSTGRDVRTNQALSPAVAVSELLDAIDLTVVSPDDRSPSAALTVDHPRQAWSDVAFIPCELGTASAWSFDRGALDAALARRSDARRPPFLAGPLVAASVDPHVAPLVTLEQLRSAVENPARVLLRDRLGMTISDAPESGDDQIPLELGGLQKWTIADELLRARLDHGLDADAAAIEQADHQWEAHERARGSVPPGRFGDDAINDAREQVNSLLSILRTELGSQPYEPSTVAVRLDLTESLGVVVEGNVRGVCGDTVVSVSPSRFKPASILTALIDLCALTLHDPERSWSAVTISQVDVRSGLTAGAHRVTLLDPTQAAEVLAVFHDLRQRAMRDAIPAFPATTRHVFAGDMKSARGAWTPNERSHFKGDRGDRWVKAIPELDVDFDALVELPSRPDELGPDGSVTTRLDYWADRLWGTVDRFAEVIEPGGPAVGPGDTATDAGDDTGAAADD